MIEQSNACSQCGAALPAAAAFCSKCGARMMPTPTPSAPFVGQSAAPPPPTVPPQKNIGKKAVAWLVGAVIVLIGSGLRQIGHIAAQNPQQTISSFHNPFGPRPPATALRLFLRGDSWDYRVSGTITLADGKSAAIQSGSLHSEITGYDGSGDSEKFIEEDTVNMTVSANGKVAPISSHTVRQTLSQDLLNGTFLMSDNDGPQGAVRTVRKPQVDTPGIWSDGLNQSSHLDFSDGESQNETTTVQGSEVVETALGKVTAWRCVQEETDSNGTHSITTLWFAPQLGMPVKTSGTYTGPSGTVMTLNTDITKTTVSL